MCKDYLKPNTTSSKDFNLVIEQCLNTSFWEQYKLKTRIKEDTMCHTKDQYYPIEPIDIVVAVILLCILILNLSGSVYHILIVKKNYSGNKWLLYFSIQRNWSKLIETTDNRKNERLKGLNGMKVITTTLIVLLHSQIPFAFFVDNEQFLERGYSNIFYHLLFDGTVIVQTFFVISGCLASYNLQLKSKENTIWKRICKRILLRWLRLTPIYAITLAITASWLRFAGSGPMWHKFIGPEIADCRRDGWQNMLYINNYFDNTRCMAHTWYVAADMQLFVLGTFTLVLTRSNQRRQVVLWSMFVLSLFIVPLHTYFQNLYAHVIIAPELVIEFFVKDSTFNHSYKRGHTNMPCYILGLIAGLIVFKLQKKQINIEKYKKYKYMFWAICPMMVILILCCGFLYMDGVTPHLEVRAAFSGIYRPLFGFFIFFFILGMVIKLENVYRPILEWRFWTSIVRLSYAVYIVHVMLIQISVYSRTTLNHSTTYEAIKTSLGTITLSYLFAIPFWLLIESPISQLAQHLTSTREIKVESKYQCARTLVN
ncbi:PREDICTED: nose resistant to fluoxetine protein 6-like isoform X2 [Papilio xuthus]|nr:PREDICTED: nose resistant to fluoxetine protein 6-like isoform X2 [Papilio xuthus]